MNNVKRYVNLASSFSTATGRQVINMGGKDKSAESLVMSIISSEGFSVFHIHFVLFLTQVTLFMAFVCFAAASRPPYIAATVLEFLITTVLVLLYMLKLNKRLTFFFWPLVVGEVSFPVSSNKPCFEGHCFLCMLS